MNPLDFALRLKGGDKRNEVWTPSIYRKDNTMKTILSISLALALAQVLPAFAQGENGGRAKNNAESLATDQAKTTQNAHAGAVRTNRVNNPAPISAPVRNNGGGAVAPPAQINLSRPLFHNNPVESENARPARQNQYVRPPVAPVQGNSGTFQAQQVNPDHFSNGEARHSHFQSNSGTFQDHQVNPNQFIAASPSSGNVVHHHHPFTQGYVRKKLQKLGVSQIPQYISDRSHILDADKRHSEMTYPKKGPDQAPLRVSAIPARDFNQPTVRDHMKFLRDSGFMDQVKTLNHSENKVNHYYWHQDSDHGYTYCHYTDQWGYHWYGWYLSDGFFWTRYYNHRWWFYDQDKARWCFWDNGFWWWQDPYHVADLYLYNNAQYIPCDSAKDAVVTTVQTGNDTVYSSPDGTRMVKIMGDSGDAFLFDTAIPASFNPLYLASQVTGVKFSNTNDGQPLEIMLTLSDGTFDFFDNQGNPLSFGDASDPYDPVHDPNYDPQPGN